MKIPYIASGWKILFKPEKHGNYINDHSIIQATDGKWHLFGITGFTGGSYNERYFAHGIGESLQEPMLEANKVIDRGTPACIKDKHTSRSHTRIFTVYQPYIWRKRLFRSENLAVYCYSEASFVNAV